MKSQNISVLPTNEKRATASSPLHYLTVPLVSAYFLFLTWRGLLEDFNNDDMMNIAVAYIKPQYSLLRGALTFWTGTIRPLGNLFYTAVYEYAGYWSLPFRIASFAVILLNFYLLYCLLMGLTRNRLFAALALLFACYHASLSDIWMSTGTVYDILCQTFVLLALNLAIASHKRLIPLGLCTIAAVDSKEMGVCIPALIFLYEVLFHSPDWKRPWTWAREHLTGVAVTGCIAAVFLASRLFAENQLSHDEAYQVHITLSHYLQTTQAYVNEILFHGRKNQLTALALFLAPLLPIALLRSRLMLFGWLYYVLALAPLSFAPVRFGYALYIPYTGVAILVTAFFFELEKRIPQRPLKVAAAAIFAFWIVQFQTHQNTILTRKNQHPGGIDQIHTVAHAVADRYPTLPKGARLLLINDPNGTDHWPAVFVLWLRYRDPTLHIERLRWDKAVNDTIPMPPGDFDHTFLFADQHSWEIRPGSSIDGRPLSFVRMIDPNAEFCIVKDVGGNDGKSEERWALENPHLRFRVPRQPAKLTLEISIPEVTLKQTGPLKIETSLNGNPIPLVTIPVEGDRTIEAPVPASLKEGETMQVTMHVVNPYVDPNGGPKLGFLLRSAGLKTVEK